MDHCLKSLTFEIFPVHFFLYQIKYSGFGNKLTRILFTVGNVDRDIGRYGGRHSGRQSVDTRSILGRQPYKHMDHCTVYEILNTLI